MDVASWLRSLGLEKYEATFRNNSITEKVLPRLTAEDLKELGVSTVGDRRVFLDAIADLRSDANTAAPAPATVAVAPKDACRTPPSHGDVFGPCGLHGAVGAHGP